MYVFCQGIDPLGACTCEKFFPPCKIVIIAICMLGRGWKTFFSRNAQRGTFFCKPNVSRSFKQIKGLEEKVPNVELSSLTSRCWYCKQPHLMGNSCLVAVRVETTFFFYLFSSSSWLMKSARCEQLRLCTDQQNTGTKKLHSEKFLIAPKS